MALNSQKRIPCYNYNKKILKIVSYFLLKLKVVHWIFWQDSPKNRELKNG